jgi:hypothetical protein
LLAATVLAACSGTGFKTDYQVAQERAAAFIAANPTLSADKKAAIRRATLVSGMAKREVIASWGRPVIVQKYRGGSQEYWLFGCHWPHICAGYDEDTDFPLPSEIYQSHAIFENGKLIKWQS